MTRMKIFSKVMSAALMLALVLTAALPALALAAPQLPHGFYGTVKVLDMGYPDDDAPAGSVVTARLSQDSGGEVLGSWTVSVAGQYGNHPWQHLLVQDPLDGIPEGTTIYFFVDGNLAYQTATFSSGTVTELNLTVPPPQCFYGTAKVRYSAGASLINAEVGKVISAYVNGVRVGSWTITTAGIYGNYLKVPGTTTDGAIIHFYIYPYEAGQTASFASGDVTQLNLTFNLYGATPTATSTPTATATATATATPTSTSVPTSTPTATSTATATPTATGTVTPTATGTVTPTPAGTITPTPAGTVTPTATGTVTPTATGTPQATVTPVPGSQSFTVGFWDNPNGGSGYIGSDGIVQAAVTGQSGAGTVSIDIPSGTEVTDPYGQPVGDLTIGLESSIPPVPEGYYLVQTFDFGPDGTEFDPYIEITLEYDLSLLPEGEEPVIAYWDESAGEWVFVTGEVNTEEGTITFRVEHFTTFAVMGQLGGAEDEESGGIPWWVWIAIAAAVLVVLLMLVVLMRRRTAPAGVESGNSPQDDDSF